MNAPRTLILATITLAAGFLAARWVHPPVAAEPDADRPLSLRQLESFYAYLASLGGEESLRRFNEYTNSTMAVRNSADLGLTLAVLHRIRGGDVDAAIRVLESRLGGDISAFAVFYRELPAELRDEVSLKVLERARDYRDKFPAKDQAPISMWAETEAFKLLADQGKR